MSDAMSTILMMSLSGTILAAVLFLLRPLVAKYVSKAFLYYIWLPVLLRLLLPFGFGVPLIRTSAAETAAQRVEAPIFRLSDDMVALAPEEGGDANAAPAEPTISGTSAMPEGAFDLGGFLRGHLVCLWLAGVCLNLGWHILSYAVFYRRLSRSFEPPRAADLDLFDSLRGTGYVRLLVSELAETPMLIGLLRPAILLPKRSFSEGELRDILCHELTHWRRRDLLYKWLAVIVQSVHWFNPVAYLIRRVLDSACELACDEAVVRFMSPRERISYANTLLALAAERAIPSRVTVSTLGEGKRVMRARIISIRDYKGRSAAAAVLMLALSVLLTACSTAVVSVSDAGASAGIAAVNPEADVPSYRTTGGEAHFLIRSDEPEPEEAVPERPTPTPAAPSGEAVLALRERVEAGMTENEIARLTETIKAANLWWEQRYMWDDIFNEYQLGDPDSLVWNYFDQTGEIQLGQGWVLDGELDKDAVCAQEGLTDEEFMEKYGVVLITQNDYDADDFIAVMTELEKSVRSGLLDEDFDRLISLCAEARDTHNVSCAAEMYRMLHDMDYFLLRYGLADVGPYVENAGMLTKYYGSLNVWQSRSAS